MELYHVLNRGVEKRNIFMDERDYVRFVHDLYEFNDEKPALNVNYSFKNMDLRNPYIRDRKLIVDVHGWCLMKNHYHLLLSERVEGGLTKFFRKLNVGYANYFNERYDRDGSLFQGRTKKIHINSDAYFLHILNYIHFNPLDYFAETQGRRTRNIENANKAHGYLLKYRWSSYPDYCGQRNFPSILTMDLFSEPPAKFKKHILEYSRDRHADLPAQFLLE